MKKLQDIHKSVGKKQEDVGHVADPGSLGTAVTITHTFSELMISWAMCITFFLLISSCCCRQEKTENINCNQR